MSADWQLLGERADFELVRERLAAWEEQRRSEIVRFEHAGRALWLKGSPFRGRSRWRHALRGVCLRQPAPRLSEYANLRWLREHDFGAPRALAAGVRRERGLPRYQFLLTEEWDAARTWEDVLEAGRDEPRRADALALLAAEVGRLHAQGFVHRDLYPRNVLLRERGAQLELGFLDAWRGGAGFDLRGPGYDLACWMLSGAELLDASNSAMPSALLPPGS